MRAVTDAAETGGVADDLVVDATGDVTDDELLALDQQVCFALAVAARSVIALYRPALEPLGLTHPQYLVMLALWQHRSLSVKELGALLLLDSGTLSPLVRRLVDAGLVTKERAAADERSVVVSLTPAGSALRRRAPAVPRAVAARLGMSAQELAVLRDGLTDVVRAAVTQGPSAP